MDISQVCEVQDILELTETKQYINFPKVILETLESAVRHKTISDSAMGLWIKLYSIVRSREVVEPEWSVRYSAKRLAEEKGCTEKTILSHLSQLEKGGFIVIDKKRNTLLHEANKIFVRFPKSGIEVAKQAPDRRRTCSTRNIESSQTNKDNLSTDSKRFFHGRSSKNYSSNINNKETNTKNNNTGSDTSLSTINDVSLDDTTTTAVDCCFASHETGTGKAVNADPVITEINKLSLKLERLKAKQKELRDAYEKDKKNIETYQQLTNCQHMLEQTKLSLENIGNSTSSTLSTTGAQVNIVAQSRGDRRTKAKTTFKRRDKPIKLPQNINAHIDNKLAQISKSHGISGTGVYAERIKLQLENFEFGESLIHAANILLKKLKQGVEILPPGGCYSSAEIDKRERDAVMSKRLEIEHARRANYGLNFAA